MAQKHVWLLFLVIFVKNSSMKSFRDEIDIDNTHTIQITRSLRTYRHGPIEGNFFATTQDDIVLTAGGIVGVGKALEELENGVNFTGKIRQWAVVEQTTRRICGLTSVHNFGEEALFQCIKPGIYRAYARDEANYNWDAFTNKRKIYVNAMHLAEIKKAGDLNPAYLKDYIEKKLRWNNRLKTEPFNILANPYSPTTIVDVKKLNDPLTGYTISDPFSVEASDYCFYWNYRINKISSTGKINDAILPDSDKKGSYNRYDIYVWIIDPSATTEEEISVDDPNKNTVVSEYSKIITKSFYAKGLVPCVRKSHGAIEVLQVRWFAEEDPANLVHYPYWRISIKLHTDRVISTLTDVTFTVASRQRVALYNCFVGDTRIFLVVFDLEFLDWNKIGTSINNVNVEISNIPQVSRDYIRHQDKIFAHGSVWAGPLSSRIYQPGSVRTDLVAITNPCKVQEFMIIPAGRIYLGTALLEKRMASVKRVYMPGLDARDSVIGTKNGSLTRPIDYYMIADIGFTPTHLVVLLEDSSVYLHPYNLKTQGIGYLTETKKFKLEALVKRRWCAQTGYLTHNMLMPAFSSTGNFILIQLFPVEGQVNIWSRPAPESCAAENRGFVAFSSNTDAFEENLRNETQIHIYERVRKSDDVGRPVALEPVEPAPPPIKKNMDEELTFLANDGEIFDEHDPHFSEEASNPASKLLGKNLTHYNLAVIYRMDDSGAKTKMLLELNGLKVSTSSNNVTFEYDNIQFTAVEKRFIIVSRFQTPQISSEREFVAMISTMTALNYPVKIKEEKSINDPEPTLETAEKFPGCLIVRKKQYEVENVYPLNGDDINVPDPADFYNGKTTKYPAQLYTLNTALPTYVVDLGQVYVYASIDGRFARPLSFYRRESILNGRTKKLRREVDSSPNFSESEPDHNIVVTEQGTISILWRKRADTPNKAQAIAIGSVYTIEPLREMKPFTSNSKIFQWATPDNEILYGKFSQYYRARYGDCNSSITDSTEELGCIKQPTSGVPFCSEENIKFKADKGIKVRVPVSPYFECEPFRFDHYIKIDTNLVKDEDLKARISNYKVAYAVDSSGPELELCSATVTESCFHIYDEVRASKLCEPGDSSNCTMPLQKHQPIFNLLSIELLGIPYYNILKGSLQYAEPEQPTTTVEKDEEKKDVTCPFAGFKVIKTNFDYAEIGYSTRITAEVSYFGKNIPLEADLLVEFENVLGIKVEIATSLIEERDQTTVTKTIDIYFHMTDIDLRKMEMAHKSKVRGTEEGLKDDARIFSITLRPSVLNLYCPKDEITTTLQINVGCNPFTKMRLISEATPFNKIALKKDRADGDLKSWVSAGNFLSVPRDEVHHRQRKQFNCKLTDEPFCLVPYANLYGTNVFNVSWRDRFTPKFEQFLTGYTRRVTGNIAIYDLLGDIVGLSLTRLDAKCYNNANKWYRKLLTQQAYLGKNVTPHEDIYEYYKDCYDQLLPREPPKLLSNESYRLHNLTNSNSFKFTRKPNPRNKIYIFRAVVVNTYYNKYTFCSNLETFFLVKIVGIPTPRQALPWKFSLAITLLILVVLVFTYIHFSFCYPWKGESDAAKRTGAAGEGNVEDDILNEEYLRDEEHTEFDFTQRVQTTDGFFEKFASKIYALARWRRKAAEEAEKRRSFAKKEH